MQKGKKFLSDLKLHSDYFKWLEDKGRYETWEDACDNIIDFALIQISLFAFQIIPPLIKNAFEFINKFH